MPRILTVNDTNTVPGAIVIVEVGTFVKQDQLHPDRQHHSLRCWSAIAGRMESGKWTRESSRHGSTASEFWSFVNYARQTEHPTTICGSSINRSLSMLDFWSLLESGEFSLVKGPHPNAALARSAHVRRSMEKTSVGILITNGPPNAVVCWNSQRWKLTIVDCRNYLDKSPREVADLTGTEYRENPLQDAPLEEWQETVALRTRASCELFKRLVVWQNRQELGRFSLTASSLAMAAFRHRFMRDRIELPDTQDERDWERAGYYNGRVEALWCGRIKDNVYTPPKHVRRNDTLFDERPTGPFHYVDARSFYAAVQTFEELPIACTESRIGGEHESPPLDDSIREVMATVTLATHDETYPVRLTAGAVYARGEFQTTLCGPELVRAWRAGHIKSWHGWRRYRLAPCLRWFAEGLWKERIRCEGEGDRLIAALCKGLMARIHGKFLQRSHRWTLIPGRIAPGPWEHWHSVNVVDGTVRKFRSVGWDVQIQDDAGDAEWCFPALAAWVTAHGREYLRHWMAVAGPRQVLYVGCDGMVTTDVGVANLTRAGLIWPDGVGSLRITETSPDIEIRGPNNYTHGSREVVSGRAYDGLTIANGQWKAKRYQGLEEIFLSSNRSQVTSFEVGGIANQFTATGTVGPGGWIDPPTLTLREKQSWQTSRQLQNSLPNEQ